MPIDTVGLHRTLWRCPLFLTMVSPQDRTRLKWTSFNGEDYETNSYMDFGWNLHYSSKERSKAMYKAIVKRLMQRFKDRYQLNVDHFYLTLACAVEWGLDDKELMRFLWKEIKLFDKGDEPTLKEEVEEIHKFVKNHIADGSGLSLLHGYYNIKATIPSAINNPVAEHDTKIISSAIDKHDCIKKAGNRCIRVKEILEYLKIHEPHLFMIMKEKRVEVFTARILQNKGYVKSRDRLGTIWENPHMCATKKVKLPYNPPRCISDEKVKVQSMKDPVLVKEDISTSLEYDFRIIFPDAPIEIPVENIIKANMPNIPDHSYYEDGKLVRQMVKELMEEHGYYEADGLYVKHTVS